MLRLRASQVRALARAQRQHVLVRLSRHARCHFPRELQPLPEAELRLRVQKVVGRARSYGLTSERDLCRFLNLAVVYGWDFDRRPENGWMRDVLQDPAVQDPSHRIRRLVGRCLRRLEVEEVNRASEADVGTDFERALESSSTAERPQVFD